MKKYAVICAGLCVAMAFTSCKSSESAYKQAYLKAKAQEEAQLANQQTTQQPVENTVVAPMQERAANNTRVVDNADNISVRQEAVSVVNGSGLKNFSVVVGSFSLIANAEGLQQTLRSAGYDAQIVLNSSVSPPCTVSLLPPSTTRWMLPQAAMLCRAGILVLGCSMPNKPWRASFL